MRLLGCAAILIAIPTSALANSVYETLAFLLFDAEKNSSSYRYVESVDPNSGNMTYSVRGVGGTKLVFTQPSACVFRITGKRWNSDQTINADYEVDLTNLQPEKAQQTMKNVDPSYTFADTVYYVRVPGAKVCSRGESFTWKRENFPPQGQCTDYMRTSSVEPGGGLDRQIAALSFLRKTIALANPIRVLTSLIAMPIAAATRRPVVYRLYLSWS